MEVAFMDSYFVPIALGVICILLGIMNMKGNISSLHWYHRQRVTEENIKPFGKLVGLGTLIIGVAMILLGVFLFAFEKTQTTTFLIVGAVLTVVGIFVGLGFSLYAMFKYNKGIF